MWPNRSFALNLATSSLDLLNSMSYDLVQFTETVHVQKKKRWMESKKRAGSGNVRVTVATYMSVWKCKSLKA